MPPPDVPVPAAVILHGIGVSHRYNDRLQEELSDTRLTLSFDLPGFAGTPRPPRPFTVADHAEVVAAALDARGLAARTVIGHSMGAQFALELARFRPDLVGALVLIGPVTDPTRATARQQALDLAADTFCEPLGTNLVVASDYLRTGVCWFFTELGPMLRYPTAEAVAAVQAPVLVVRGSRDPIAREPWCRELASRAADGRLLEVRGHGHVVQRSAARTVAASIEQFVAELAEQADLAEQAEPAEAAR
ncbi:alpha/beta fold hydrolase [Herbiconiux sp. VKM Ac-1786]|uniref:alpha/beta fold hydrolase n=1 Tax=Herbiconiux sp. VKM Ac-1786 TaxID=2783824 RepID=UPI00188BAB3E|nr:alpha/beta fold hydrolase [Herbiconiux sp. VKM Ac-1786]